MQYKLDIIHSLHNFTEILGRYIGYYIAVLLNKIYSFI